MRVLKTIAAAFSMFSAIPMPRRLGTDHTLRYMLCAFPLVGLVIGLLMWFWAFLCDVFALPYFVRAIGFTLIPVAITGGIHLDGYCDTCDARASHADPARRREILKDPHIGAFGVIHLVCYLLLTLVLWSVLYDYPTLVVICGMCLSRTLSGLAVVSFPLAEGTGLAHTFADAAGGKRVRNILIVIAVVLDVLLFLFGFVEGLAVIVAELGCWFWLRRMARTKFCGLSGDLAGWFVQAAELAILIALVIVAYVGAMPV